MEQGETALIDALTDAEIAFVTSRISVSRQVIDRGSNLEIMGKLGTGIDNVDLSAASEQDVIITHTPGHNALSAAEHSLCLLLAAMRRLTESRELIENDQWRDAATLGTHLSGSTVGIIGFGNVGKRLGMLLTGFDVDIVVHDPYVASIDAEFVGGEPDPLDDLLRQSDCVCLTTELTEETRGLIGERELSLMPSSSFLVNTARGPVVEESALVDVLRTGAIAGAGLDVFSTEPVVRTLPGSIWTASSSHRISEERRPTLAAKTSTS